MHNMQEVLGFLACRIAGRHLVLSSGNTTHNKLLDDCAVYLCTVVSSQHQASLLWRGLGLLATFALQSCLMCSILRIMSLQLGASVVTVDDRCPERSVCGIFVVCRGSLSQPTHVAFQPFRRRTHLSKLMQELVMACLILAISMLYCSHLWGSYGLSCHMQACSTLSWQLFPCQ